MAPSPTPPAAATPQDAEPPEVQSPDADTPPPAPHTDADADAAPLPDAEAPKPDSPAAPQPHLPEGILEDIFLRLPTAGDVARASAACSAFRAITSGQPFRRRFRALHRAPLLGFLREDFYPARAPHPSAPAARALAGAADFAFSFLPGDADCWSPRDARDGRVLFSAVPASHGRGSFADATSTTFVDLVVADPLSRRCARVPPVPDGLASPVLRCGMLDFEPFLAPATAEDLRDEDAPFRVIGKVLCEDRVAVFAFSSRTGEWRSHGSSDLSNDFALDALYERRHYVQGCFCWLLEWMEKLLMLDAGTMEFSILDLPPGNDERRFAILEAGQGRIGLLNIGRNTLDLYYKAWPSKRGGAQAWQHETKDHPLPDYHWRIIGSDEEYLLLRGISLDWPWFGSASSESPDIEYFALELKALRLERMYVSKHKMLHAHLYRGYPPQISAPTL
ncbi:uncharacterized protein LOC123407162 [Hordeum vulgare subsp. vulgare]|uniref:F-box domain-containing protein n=1 Tax=Hordeum vulgare subsp. vulgare TaxID=112509 RepID=A0A8I7BD51_HORVV|nr:uncharacterized protein LOC123407162 [Hordeum vulgare subsp. vulgare]XP_044956169.1 uncharacterized protein LOC123407162 [Hordeum vulgare subsp. vulgare]